MKFLHTADWHLGRTVRGHSREGEHEALLAEMLDLAHQHAIDCFLLAGDVFDTATPPPEAERIAYRFFGQLHELGIPAVVIAGNHDHPRRIEALAPLLRALDVYAVGRPSAAANGGVVEIKSRDGSETAVIAALPWVSERDAIDFATLSQETGLGLGQYAERVRQGLEALCAEFRPETVNILVTHAFVDEAEVGPGGGERPLSISLGIYGLPRQMLPMTPQYIALGHVHKPQTVRPSPPAWYSGSPLQLDFGETRQPKFINLVEAHPGRPAEVSQLPLTGGRPLIDIGSSQHGVHLAELASKGPEVGEAWLRVFVELDEPTPNLPALVRETLPNAVHVERVRHEVKQDDGAPSLSTLSPQDLFSAFYRSTMGRSAEPSPATVQLFQELLQEEMTAGLTDPGN